MKKKIEWKNKITGADMPTYFIKKLIKTYSHKIHKVKPLKRYSTLEKACNFIFSTETPSKNVTFKKNAS